MHKIQAVQPVQKEIISRAEMFGGEQDGDLGFGNRQAGDILSKWARMRNQQEREQHLRSYHQQIQQPPILPQKSSCQAMQMASDLQYRSCSRSEMSPSEDLDDSDFSEDSFSFSSHYKKERKEPELGEKISFFLHEGSPGKELGTSLQTHNGLSINCVESREDNQNGDWRQATGSSSSQNGEQFAPCFKQNGWSLALDCSCECDSRRARDSPEKPYSSQEDPGNPIKSNRCNTASSESTSGLMAPLTVSLLRGNWSFDSDHHLEPPEISDGQITREGRVSVDDDWLVTAQLNSYEKNSQPCTKCKVSTGSGLSPGDRSSDPSRATNLPLDVFPNSYDADTEETPSGVNCVGNISKPEDTSSQSSGTVGDIRNGKVPIELSLSVTTFSPVKFKGTDPPREGDILPMKPILMDREPQDFEETFTLPLRNDQLESLKTKLLQCLFGSIIESRPSGQIHTEPIPSTTGSCQRSPSESRSQKTKALEQAQQRLVQTHRDQLNELTGLCCRAESLLSQTSSGDFKDYVTKLDELLSLKWRYIQSMRDELRLFVAYSQGDEMTDRDFIIDGANPEIPSTPHSVQMGI
ncbi:hypothetical protein GDO86_002606 [Hymenochirus boettgeri]|uniref:Uncharacterized protein n=1 Tax=Hymenochirus boettgeri TaxID=247094 RepID=A0A8T2KIS2_9PIPI|nr:hypothetical protein GDO86_002606 [Hymenochirus boettgeri]